MRVLLLIAALWLAGCSSAPTLEELKEQAMISGDWSAVEARERILARRAARRGPKCPSGQVAYCEVNFGRDRCQCVSQEAMRNAFSWRN
ncbi:MAG: hypothetical protein R3288_01695 [Woeseiaceae bacterium]|nr:hypothetical protein [Woeseiaceae bacterium]